MSSEDKQNADNKANDVEKGGLEDSDLKKDADQEEPAEDSPLKGDKSNMDSKDESGGPGGEKSGAKEGAKGLREWLSKSRVKWWIAVLVAIILLTVVLVGTLLAVEADDYEMDDKGIRLVKLWPRPNARRNTIYFRHGSLPVEGRVWPELTKQLDSLLARYSPNANRSKKVVECFGSSPPPLQDDKICRFDIRPLMLECSKAMNYGYDQGSPCVFLEFTNVTGWIPELYSARELENLAGITDRTAANMVYLDCKGDTLVDQEHMGRIQYTPDRGFPVKYFPYKGQREYMTPIVAIRFNKPVVGVAFSVTCKLWAKNINHTDEAVPSGQISFNLLVE